MKKIPPQMRCIVRSWVRRSTPVLVVLSSMLLGSPAPSKGACRAARDRAAREQATLEEAQRMAAAQREQEKAAAEKAAADAAAQKAAAEAAKIEAERKEQEIQARAGDRGWARGGQGVWTIPSFLFPRR